MGSGDGIVNGSSGIQPVNYFNTQIIERHDEHMWLNNSMAECYDFCQNIAEIVGNEIDAKWWASMKKAHICYDV